MEKLKTENITQDTKEACKQNLKNPRSSVNKPFRKLNKLGYYRLMQKKKKRYSR